jgi:hypothetical protein
MFPRKKKAALELSVGTIVIIVIAMSMLILGLVLVRNIFTGSIHNVDLLNQKVKGEIEKLFVEEGKKVAVYLPKSEAQVKKGDSFGVAFGVKNTAQGEATAARFSYSVKASDVQRGCQLSLQQADTYVTLGGTRSFDLSPGSSEYNLVKIQPPESAPLCEIFYDIIVTTDGQPFENTFFIIKITS